MLRILLTSMLLIACQPSQVSLQKDCKTDLYENFTDRSEESSREYDFLLEDGVGGKKEFNGTYYPLQTAQSLYYMLPQSLKELLPDSFKLWLDRDCSFKNFGIIRSNKWESYAYAVEDSKIIAGSCFACHASVFDHQFVPGLFNSYVDTQTNSVLLKQLPIKPAGNDNLLLILQLAQSQETKGKSFGTYNIFPYFSAAGLNRKNLENFPDLMESILNSWIYVDPNPWWLNKYKSSYFRVGWITDNNTYKLANGFHQVTNTKTMEEFVHNMKESIDFTKKVEVYMQKMSSPIYPYPLDGYLVAIGSRIFHNVQVRKSCADCHGIYQKQPGSDWSEPGHYLVSYKDKVVDVETDQAYRTYYRTTNQKIIDVDRALNPEENSNLFTRLNDVSRKLYDDKFYYLDEDLIDYEGYIAPPLDGVWASGPYLHNGSVPSLWTLLSPEQRPQIWRKDLEKLGFNQKEVGIPFHQVDSGSYDDMRSRDAQNLVFSSEHQIFRSIYDTQVYGQGNGGHNFGSLLSEQDKRALIEFLKSLSGPNMQSNSSNTLTR